MDAKIRKEDNPHILEVSEALLDDLVVNQAKVIKEKKGVITVIEYQGNYYSIIHQDHFRNKKGK